MNRSLSVSELQTVCFVHVANNLLAFIPKIISPENIEGIKGSKFHVFCRKIGDFVLNCF